MSQLISGRRGAETVTSSTQGGVHAVGAIVCSTRLDCCDFIDRDVCGDCSRQASALEGPNRKKDTIIALARAVFVHNWDNHLRRLLVHGSRLYRLVAFGLDAQSAD